MFEGADIEVEEKTIYSRSRSTVWLLKAIYNPAEIGIVIDHALDLFDRMHHGGVVLVVEEASDLGIGKFR